MPNVHFCAKNDESTVFYNPLLVTSGKIVKCGFDSTKMISETSIGFFTVFVYRKQVWGVPNI